MELASDLDGSPYGAGRKLDGVRFLPIGADFNDADVATGPQWVAFREPVIRNWRLARVASIKSVALMGPTVFASASGHGTQQPVPELVIGTTDGSVMRAEVTHISPPARHAILRHLPENVEVTLAARGFLVHGHVPQP